MAAPATTPDTTLPLAWRLRRALLVALLLGLWAPVKVAWEQHIAREQDFLRYRGTTITRDLRDELGQGMSIGVLSGMRNVVADLLWLQTVSDWENRDWFGLSRVVALCTALQPRAPMFWDMGGWHLAWNASIDALENPLDHNDLKKLKASRYWIDRGLDLYLRGAANNPTYWRIWDHIGILYQQRLKEPEKAAYYYQLASEQPGAPIYLERHPAIMYGAAGDTQAEYQAWKNLYLRLTPEQLKDPQHARDRVESEIRRLEKKLSVPIEKRVFPN